MSMTGLFVIDLSHIGVFGFHATLFMFLIPLILILFIIKGLRIKRLSLDYGKVSLVFFVSVLINWADVRISSVSLLFFWLLSSYLFIIGAKFTVTGLRVVLKEIMWLHFLFSMIVMIFYLLGLDVVSDYHTLKESKFAFPRFMGFSTEPSHAAIVSLVSFLGLVQLEVPLQERKKYFLLLFASMMIYQSAYGFIFLLIYYRVWFEEIFQIRSFRLRILAISLITLYAITQMPRLYSFYMAFSTGNLELIDGSAFVRVLPFISYLEMMEKMSWSTLIFGMGSGQSAFIVNDLISTTKAGHISGFLMDYGFLGFIAYITLFRLVLPSVYILEYMFLFLLLVFNINISTQIFWYVFVILYLVKNFRNYEVTYK